MWRMFCAIMIGVLVTVGVGAAVGIDALRWSQGIAARVLPDGVGNELYAIVADGLGPVIWALPGLIVAVLIAGWRRHPGPNCCRACGYDLTGNVSGRCPECGATL